MTTKINGRTPEEIKKGLETCAAMQGCGSCPYSGTRCVIEVSNDVLSYIQQLEAERDELLQKNQQLERERDAAIKDMYHASSVDGSFCDICKYNGPQCEEEKFTYIDCYEWRGVQEEV